MTDAELDELAQHLPLLKMWITHVEAELLRRLESGAEMQNAELVPKRAVRSWDGEVDMKEILPTFGPIDVVCPRVPLSPTQAQEILGQEAFSGLTEYVQRNSSGLTLSYRV